MPLSLSGKKGYTGSSIVCPHCQANARFDRYRKCAVTTLLGKVVYERAYYSCSSCGHGHFPTDEVFRIQRKQDTRRAC